MLIFARALLGGPSSAWEIRLPSGRRVQRRDKSSFVNLFAVDICDAVDV